MLKEIKTISNEEEYFKCGLRHFKRSKYSMESELFNFYAYLLWR